MGKASQRQGEQHRPQDEAHQEHADGSQQGAVRQGGRHQVPVAEQHPGGRRTQDGGGEHHNQRDGGAVQKRAGQRPESGGDAAQQEDRGGQRQRPADWRCIAAPDDNRVGDQGENEHTL